VRQSGDSAGNEEVPSTSTTFCETTPTTTARHDDRGDNHDNNSDNDDNRKDDDDASRTDAGTKPGTKAGFNKCRMFPSKPKCHYATQTQIVKVRGLSRRL